MCQTDARCADGVVDAFDDTPVQWIAATGENTVPLALHALGKRMPRRRPRPRIPALTRLIPRLVRRFLKRNFIHSASFFKRPAPARIP